jgi:two-component system chemotaxis response regulator CheY
MSNKIALVGHCGPDSSYLRYTVMKADKDAKIVMADDEAELQAALENGVDLILFNRELGYGFAEQMGVDVIKRLRAANPNLKMMLVSNYRDAQAEAVANGALPGFGKRELGSPQVLELLKEALKPTEPAQR